MTGLDKPEQTAVNDSGTMATADTGLTQRRSLDVLTSHLAKKRRAAGPDTPTGHTCSNLMEQIGKVPTYDRQEWATHPMQTLEWWMARQLGRLEG